MKNLVHKLTETETQFDTKVAESVKASVAEKRSIQTKHEQTCAESKKIKRENEELKKDVNSLNVALKSAKKETKETHFEFVKKVKEMEGKIETLQEYKLAKASEEKELKSKSKKVDKKLKLLGEKEAKINLELIKLKRDTEITTNNNSVELDEKPNIDKNGKEVLKFCKHSPQCSIRQPKPPPFGPPTQTQFETTKAATDNEAKELELKDLTDQILDFFQTEPVSDMDFTITKLEMIKSLFEPKNNEERDLSKFDDLIKIAKENKDIIENIEKEAHDDEHSYEDYFDDNLPIHFYGEDGELIFDC